MTPRLTIRGMVAALAASLLVVQVPGHAGGGVVGEPQPGAAPFAAGFGPGGGGTGAILPDGSTVLASVDNTGSFISVCVVPRGGHACSQSPGPTIPVPKASDAFSGVPIVLSTGGDDVAIVVDDCCSVAPDVLVVYDSTNGGRTFGHAREAGTLQTMTSAVYLDGEIVAAGVPRTIQGVDLQMIQATPTAPATAVVNLNGGADYAGDLLLSVVGGGLVVAYDLPDAFIPTTYLYYAKEGSDLASAASYTQVTTISNEDLLGIAGSTLLTIAQSNPQRCVVRSFDGSNLGAAITVPTPRDLFQCDGVAAGDGSIHVFESTNRLQRFALSEQTLSGARWRSRLIAKSGGEELLPPQDPVLTPAGTGVAFLGGAFNVVAYPVLDAQTVRFIVSPVRLSPGAAATAVGTASPASPGRDVTLQRFDAGRWYAAAETHETAGGRFSLRVTATTSEALRAVVSAEPGVQLLGYSNPVVLHVAG